HPNIVQIYDIGEYDDLPYCALEYLEGGCLHQKLQGQPQPPRQAARWMEQIAAAVHAAHEKGVVHRDLKPANILLATDETPKGTAFGLAKKPDDDLGHTGTGAVMGTPAYMAPEQAAGKTKEIGPAADVYSLGAILYECLTGRTPLRGDSVVDT